MTQLSICASINDIPAEQWNALAGDINPFIQHAFLLAFETGQCLQGYGWSPKYFLVHDNNNELIGAMPAYEKDNSYGEFILLCSIYVIDLLTDWSFFVCIWL